MCLLDPNTPPQPVALPSGYRLLWNRLRRTRVDRELDCGCIAQAGTHYHSVGIKVQRSLLYLKRHVWACPKGSGQGLQAGSLN